MPCDHLISVRVTEQTKQRFRALAEREGTSESALLKRLMDLALIGVDGGLSRPAPEPIARDARLYVRLALADRRRLAERAAARQLRPATYVALLVRGHLAEAAPVPSAELAALVHSVAELAKSVRVVERLARAASAGTNVDSHASQVGVMLLKACKAAWDDSRALVTANTASWRGGAGRG